MRMKFPARLLLVLSILPLSAGSGLAAGKGKAVSNGRIAFSKDVGGVSEIFVMNGDGTKMRRLTRFDELRPGVRGRCGAYNRSPEWSPDGTRLVFRAGGSWTSDLYLVNADGSGMRRLTRDRAMSRHPAWTP